MLGRKLAAAAASLLAQAKWSYIDTLSFLVDTARFRMDRSHWSDRIYVSMNFHEFPTLL
jgi:hypothetical protein